MKRIPCRVCCGMLEPSKVAALFYFLSSSYHRFAKAFVYLSGILSPFHSSICSCTCELSATESRQAGQSSPIPYAQRSAGPTSTQNNIQPPPPLTRSGPVQHDAAITATSIRAHHTPYKPLQALLSVNMLLGLGLGLRLGLAHSLHYD